MNRQIIDVSKLPGIRQMTAMELNAIHLSGQHSPIVLSGLKKADKRWGKS